MLTKQRIEALLKLNTQNNKDTIALRIMSCSNPIKELYVYELSTIKKEYEEKQVGPKKLDMSSLYPASDGGKVSLPGLDYQRLCLP